MCYIVNYKSESKNNTTLRAESAHLPSIFGCRGRWFRRGVIPRLGLKKKEILITHNLFIIFDQITE
jgi:hypothetical protein